jgi:hypothetical protein
MEKRSKTNINIHMSNNSKSNAKINEKKTIFDEWNTVSKNDNDSEE